MDWRNRKYYQVNPVYSYHDCIKRLKKINSVKISPPFRVSGGRTKEVRTSGDRDDPGGYRRLAAIEGRAYARPVKRKSMTFYFVYHSTAISVPDTSKCS